MPTYRHIVRLPYATGLAGDESVNVFHSLGSVDADAVAFSNDLIAFYQAIDGVVLSTMLNDNPNACSVKTYDLSDPEPRVPFSTLTFGITPNTSSMPTEMALCVSFRSAIVSGVPQARRRGRVFIGPLGGIHDGVDTMRPTAAAINALVTAADNLQTAGSLPGHASWAVYSPTDGNAFPVASGWVDNEYDVVRSRGRQPTARTTWT